MDHDWHTGPQGKVESYVRMSEPNMTTRRPSVWSKKPPARIQNFRKFPRHPTPPPRRGEGEVSKMARVPVGEIRPLYSIAQSLFNIFLFPPTRGTR